MAEVSAEIMAINNLTSDDIAYLLPHQANKRICEATANRMGLSPDKMLMNIERYGNTTAGTIPLLLPYLTSIVSPFNPNRAPSKPSSKSR